MVDPEDYHPLFSFVTLVNVSDQKMVEPFVAPLEKMGYHSEMTLLNAGYDSEKNHLFLREQLCCVNLICPNELRGKRTFAKKLINSYRKMLYQTTTDKYIPENK